MSFGALRIETVATSEASARLARSLQVPQAIVPQNGQMFRLAPGREVRLRNAYLITCQSVVKNAAGEITVPFVGAVPAAGRTLEQLQALPDTDVAAHREGATKRLTDAGAHLVDEVEHLRIARVLGLVDPIEPQGLGGAAAALVESRDETLAGTHLGAHVIGHGRNPSRGQIAIKIGAINDSQFLCPGRQKRKVKALVTTETELSAIANPANSGFKISPTPAKTRARCLPVLSKCRRALSAPVATS